MATLIPCLAVRGSSGVGLSFGPPKYEDVSSFVKDEGKSCNVMSFSPDGRYLAWISPPVIKIANCSTWKVDAVIDKPKAYHIEFSPLGNFLSTWEPFIVSKNNPQGGPQLFIWRSANGELVHSLVQKRQIDWEPQWSKDEKLCAVQVNSDILIYENADFNNIKYRMNDFKVGKFKLSPTIESYFMACSLPGKNDQPSFARIYEYPKLEISQSKASKSFFQADRVNFFWNKTGNCVLVLTAMDVDKTGASYYGKQALHYLNIKGETAMITLSQEGPIHAVEWSPKSTEFCVIYGFMPSRATLFNLKCEPVFEFGKKHRNSIYFNPHGNIVMLAGFGNLRGNIELWDMENHKLIAEANAPDSTLVHWSPDGQHFMTATTAPRLMIANGYKIWHYTGALIYERPWSNQEKLYEVLWQTFPEDTFPIFQIEFKPVEGIAPSQPQASKQVYVPPSQRGRPIHFKLHDDDDDDNNTGSNKNEPSKAALKAKRKRAAKKAKRDLVNANGEKKTESSTENPKPRPVKSNSHPPLDPEKAKKISKIKAKLDQISKLKEHQSAGKTLEMNQLEKIKKEEELSKELDQLTL